MPCHRCGARQTDPVRGASPWRRGVRSGEQVLICPECQRGRDWTADLSRCGACGSARLVRVLGSTACKDCGAEDQVAPPASALGSGSGSGSEAGGGGASGTPGSDETVVSQSSAAAALAAEVQAALDRQFGH